MAFDFKKLMEDSKALARDVVADAMIAGEEFKTKSALGQRLGQEFDKALKQATEFGEEVKAKVAEIKQNATEGPKDSGPKL